MTSIICLAKGYELKLNPIGTKNEGKYFICVNDRFLVFPYDNSIEESHQRLHLVKHEVEFLKLDIGPEGYEEEFLRLEIKYFNVSLSSLLYVYKPLMTVHDMFTNPNKRILEEEVFDRVKDFIQNNANPRVVRLNFVIYNAWGIVMFGINIRTRSYFAVLTKGNIDSHLWIPFDIIFKSDEKITKVSITSLSACTAAKYEKINNKITCEINGLPANRLPISHFDIFKSL